MQTILIIIVAAVVLYILFRAAKILLRVLVLLAILGVAYLTNPELGKHRQAVEKKADEFGVDISHDEITCTDYKVFSLTKTLDDGHESLIGVGAFTKVWIFKVGPDYHFF